MLRPTSHLLTNLMFLRDITFPEMFANPESVNMAVIIHEHACGTYACLGGRYLLQRYPQQYDAVRNRAERCLEEWDRFLDLLPRDFPFMGSEWVVDDPIFGIASQGTLEERAARVNRMIVVEQNRIEQEVFCVR